MDSKQLVVLVDDEEDILDLLASLLEDISELKTFSDPTEAAEFIGTNQPDLLVTDQHMPRISGTELIEKTLSVWPDVRCVVISGDIEFTEKTQYLKDKGIPLIKKPFKNIYGVVEQLERLPNLKKNARIMEENLIIHIFTLKIIAPGPVNDKNQNEP